jgi:Ca2+-binding RTX toxin-like protein
MPAVWTQQQIIDNLLRGNTFWTGSSITCGFPTTDPGWEVAAFGVSTSGWSTLTAAQKAAATVAIGLWDDLIAPSVTLTTGASNITLSNFKVDATNDPTATHGYYAVTYTSYYVDTPHNRLASGDVFLNSKYNSTSGTNDLVTPSIGQWGFNSYVHELGHAFGLKHPGNYNGGTPTYAVDGAYTHDSIEYSIMSYFDASNTGADWQATNGQFYYPETPMIDDVAAMQQIYGADMTTRTGNTVYGFNSTLSAVSGGIYDFTQNAHPIMTIWDAAGTDTLDLSGFTTNSRIDLHAGASTDCDGMTNNIWIAYNCSIENATGGSGNDTIIGNDLGNTLSGGAGTDTITGGAGNDILIGGSGADTINGGGGINTVSYAGSGAGVTVDLRLTTAQVSTGDASGDKLSNIQNFIGSSNNDLIIAAVQNTIIDAGAGDDVIVNSSFYSVMTGGIGNDTFVFDAAYITAGKQDLIKDFSRNATGAGDQIAVVGVSAASVTYSTLGPDQATVTYLNAAGTSSASIMLWNQTSQNSNVLVVNGYSSLLNAETHNLANGYTKVFDSYSNANTWKYYVNSYDANAVLSSKNTVYDDGSRVFDSYDTTNQSWTTITDSYNASNVLVSRNTINDNGTRTLVTYDTTGQSWNSVTDSFNASNLLTSRNTINDDSSHTLITYDTTGQLWNSVTDSFSASNVLLTHNTLNDDGTRELVTYDTTHTQNWTSINQKFDSLGRADTTTYALTDSTSSVYHYDHLSNQAWSYYSERLSSTGDIMYLSMTNHDGTSSIRSYDYLKQQSYYLYMQSFDSAGHLQNSATYYDDGTSIVVYQDYLNNQTWNTNTLKTDQTGNTNYWSLEYKDGTRYVQFVDTTNSQTWHDNSIMYDAAGKMVYWQLVYDDTSIGVQYYDHNNNQTWSSYTDHYDTNHKIDHQTIYFDDLTVSAKTFDVNNAALWSQDIYTYDSNNVATHHYQIMDNGTTLIFF